MEFDWKADEDLGFSKGRWCDTPLGKVTIGPRRGSKYTVNLGPEMIGVFLPSVDEAVRHAETMVLGRLKEAETPSTKEQSEVLACLGWAYSFAAARHDLDPTLRNDAFEGWLKRSYTALLSHGRNPLIHNSSKPD